VRARPSGSPLAWRLAGYLRAPGGFLPDRRSLRSPGSLPDRRSRSGRSAGRSASSAHGCSGDLRCGPTTTSEITYLPDRLRRSGRDPVADSAGTSSLRSMAGPPRRRASAPSSPTRRCTSRPRPDAH